MGCGASRLEGGVTVFPARLRPLFIHRLEDIRLRRHTRPSKDFDSTPSKKELLLPDREEDEDTASSSHKTGFKTAPVSPLKEQNEKEEGTPKKEASHHKMEEEEEEEEEKFFTDFENEDDNDERMISCGDGGSPGSPSFRVYFKEDEKKVVEEEEEGDIRGKNDAFKNIISSDDNTSFDEATSSKESSQNNKKVKRGRKKRSFRKVFPRGGQVKNLLNVTSCYTPPPPIQDNTKLLPDKTISNERGKHSKYERTVKREFVNRHRPDSWIRVL